MDKKDKIIYSLIGFNIGLWLAMAHMGFRAAKAVKLAYYHGRLDSQIQTLNSVDDELGKVINSNKKRES